MSDTTDSTDTTTADATTTDTTTTDATQTATSDAAKADEKDWEAESVKWKAFARKHEDAAKANADKAKRFDEFEESQKTEQQRLADRAATAEAKVVEIEARALRAEVAAAKGIPAALLAGSTQEELEASADALLAFRGEKPKPDFGGGDRGGDVKPGTQLSQADVKKLYAEKRYDEIEAARQGGRITGILGAPQ